MRTLIFATQNHYKVAEVQQIAGGQLNILSLQDAGYSDVMLFETSDTLQGNAQQKAEALYALTGKDCFAEDTGLEVDVLDGAPGVYTARYAGIEGDPTKNMQKLLTALAGEQLRTARFRTALALILHGKLYSFEGIVKGKIADYPRGSGGFGYDPVFIPEGYTETFAELPAEIKNRLSHRAQAILKMLDFLKTLHYI